MKFFAFYKKNVNTSNLNPKLFLVRVLAINSNNMQTKIAKVHKSTNRIQRIIKTPNDFKKKQQKIPKLIQEFTNTSKSSF